MTISPVQTSHLCLVGEEAITNITPLLDSNFRPAKAYLAVAPEYSQMAVHLAKVFKQLGVAHQEIAIDTAWDIERIREQLMGFMETQQNNDIMLNLSGGTRSMTLAAHEVFLAYERPVFHVHPHTDRIVWLSPSNRPSFDLEDKLKLREFFLARGSSMTGSPMRNRVSQNRQVLTANLIQDIDYFAKPLRTLNWLAAESRGSLSSPKIKPTQNNDLLELIKVFETDGLCRLDDDQLFFRSEEDRFYCNGGWLEEYVYSQILAIKEELQIQDVAMGVEIERQGYRNNPIRNELDVAFLADNKFYLIECKTRSFKHMSHEGGAGAETLYKLDSLVDLLAGTAGKGMLVSYLPLSKWDKQRATDLGLMTCVGHDLQNLRSFIQRWVENETVKYGR